jgi:hypothetical protein
MTRSARFVARSAIVLVTVTLAVLVTLDGVAIRLAQSDPVLAAQLSPGNAAFAIAAAAHLAGNEAGTRDPRVRALEETALDRSATDPSAIAIRALEARVDGDARREARLFALSNAISRRNLPTRLWLIQNAVDHGDVTGALRNFDLALRTSADAPASLFPVLAAATADPQMTAPFAQLLDRPSDWRATFFHYVTTQTASATGLARIVAHLHDRAWLATNALDDALIVRLVADGEFPVARQTYDVFHRNQGASLLVRDGQFSNPAAVFPFGWLLIQKGEIGAERSVIGGRPVLSYQALSGSDGAVANQLLTLPAGHYRFAVRAAIDATDPQSPPYWTLTCAGDGATQIGLLDAPVMRNATAAKAMTVPAGCTAQWLVLSLRGSDQPSGQSGALTSVALTREP